MGPPGSVAVTESLTRELNAVTPEARLAALRRVRRNVDEGSEQTVPTIEVNNHVHSIYSFSPYSPTMIAYRAWKAGLQAVGAMDHDSVAGGEELIEACKIMGIGSTVGCEIRVNFSGTSVEGKKLNNPDSVNIGYITFHGIPRPRLAEVSRFLAPVRAARNRRNRRMVERVNEIAAAHAVEAIDYYRDVFDVSQAAHGGTITERHIVSALAGKIIEKTGRGTNLVAFAEKNLRIELAPRVREYLLDEQNPHYRYDLIGVLKSSFVPQFYLQPDTDECMPVSQAVEFADSVGAIPCYAYLGDVTESPTGDKKPEKFEDDYLDELIAEVKRIGFKAITYMPPRNSRRQLTRIRELSRRYDFMEISGVDINSSRQSFSCPEILDPAFHYLIESTWALIAHEKLAGVDERYAIFSPANPLASRALSERIERYARIGERLDPERPEEALGVMEGARGEELLHG